MIVSAPLSLFATLVTISIIGATTAAILLIGMILSDWRRGKLW